MSLRLAPAPPEALPALSLSSASRGNAHEDAPSRPRPGTDRPKDTAAIQEGEDPCDTQLNRLAGRVLQRGRRVPRPPIPHQSSLKTSRLYTRARARARVVSLREDCSPDGVLYGARRAAI